MTRGFSWTKRDGFLAVDGPHGKGTTTVSGVDSAGDLVGFCTGKTGNTGGFFAIPAIRR